ncbi:hypothetical protein U0070_000700 [Myodes glareolus]|uniref:DNA repair protein SWI5 homolog n=1 Tax=Myodes glareolus TaxID=447135 RepID=A0AAW0IGD0_MYOGA
MTPRCGSRLNPNPGPFYASDDPDPGTSDLGAQEVGEERAALHFLALSRLSRLIPDFPSLGPSQPFLLPVPFPPCALRPQRPLPHPGSSGKCPAAEPRSSLLPLRLPRPLGDPTSSALSSGSSPGLIQASAEIAMDPSDRRGYCVIELEDHIALLHEYNDIKDVAQMLLGKLALTRGVTIKELYPDFDLDLSD